MTTHEPRLNLMKAAPEAAKALHAADQALDKSALDQTVLELVSAGVADQPVRALHRHPQLRRA